MYTYIFVQVWFGADFAAAGWELFWISRKQVRSRHKETFFYRSLGPTVPFVRWL